ncbi:TIGR00341 family protein [Methanobacterium sp. VT]|uniref:TIGR00341 family protein n=2 Tax=Methanobacterium spitsbergense TaxID=2874285 RepID=A0A8T5UQW8_9EURY|nr:TIGR00341 family protein [Methanobacterium spitsbergense]
MSELTNVYMILVAASALVASIGLINDDVAVIIGTMIIEPLIGPNIGLSLANVVGDNKLRYKAIKTNIIGILIVFVISFIMGMLWVVNPQNSSIVLRTNVAAGSILLALASGLAGLLAITTELSSSFVGVMISCGIIATTSYIWTPYRFRKLYISIKCIDLIFSKFG